MQAIVSKTEEIMKKAVSPFNGACHVDYGWLSTLALIFALSWSPAYAGSDKSPYSGPDDPAAEAAAEAALATLGASRGALQINASKRALIVEARDTQSDIRDMESRLADLGAVQSDLGYELTLSGDVLFDFDQWSLRPQAQAELQKIAGVITDLGSAQVEVTGYTDSKGSDDYNQRLSEQRANSVCAWLESHLSVPANTDCTASGKGEADPVAANTRPDGSDNPEGRAQNRRVELFLQRSQ